MPRKILTHYLAHSGGSAVERVLITAVIGSLIVSVLQNPDLLELEKSIWENLFASANKRASF